MNTQQKLLSILQDGACHSGAALGEALSISRAAVWKQIQVLQQNFDLPIHSQKGSGYQLARALDLLDAKAINTALSDDSRVHLQPVQVLFSTDSTNKQLLQAFRESGTASELPPVILAEHQQAGRGRRGRSWHSPFASSLYLTLGWRFQQGFAAMEGLSLLVGLRVLKVLEVLGAEQLQLKWPNDLVWQGRKLGGILLEAQGDPVGECEVAIGIGLNINLSSVAESDIDQPWVDLTSVFGGTLPAGCTRSQLTALIVNDLCACLLNWQNRGISFYAEEWNRYDAFKQQSVCLSMGDTLISGQGKGINSQGAYGIDTATGLQYYSGGEMSLRLT